MCCEVKSFIFVSKHFQTLMSFQVSLFQFIFLYWFKGQVTQKFCLIWFRDELFETKVHCFFAFVSLVEPPNLLLGDDTTKLEKLGRYWIV